MGSRLIGRRLIPSLIELNVVQQIAIALFDPGLLMIVLRNRPRAQKVRSAILELPRPRREMLFFGRFSGRERYCPLCQSQVRLFLPFGDLRIRPNAWCPGCGSLERHRLAWMVLQQKTNLFEPFEKSLLHIAPEEVMGDKFRNLSYLDYLSADLSMRGAMVKMDITEIPYPDNTFDIIYCSHVLEHVPDDRQAMRELYRVLKPDGFALLMVPVTRREKTFEDPSITDPAERAKEFGQADHVRIYGSDFKDRLEDSGFSTRDFAPEDIVDENDTFRFGMVQGGYDIVFICSKSV
jgi:SAM-dependent methyltransferase